MEDEQ
jgi:hypothetical protein